MHAKYFSEILNEKRRLEGSAILK